MKENKHKYKLLSTEHFHGMFKAGQGLESAEFQNTSGTQMYQVKYAELVYARCCCMYWPWGRVCRLEMTGRVSE